MTATSVPRPPDRETIHPLLLSALDKAHAALDGILPLPPAPARPALRDRLTTFATSRPHLATFLLSQLVFCALPLLLFLVAAVGTLVASLLTALVAGVLGAVLFTGLCLAVAFLFVLMPVLVVAVGSGTAAWLWGWGAYYALWWVGAVDWDDGDGRKGGEQRQQQQQQQQETYRNGVREKDTSRAQSQGEEDTDTDTAAGAGAGREAVVKREQDGENARKTNGSGAVVDGEEKNIGPNTSMGTDHVV
ncbi:hypothetical protein VTN02DRAFT_4839 [Thermoascus thermophilus]